MLIRIVKMQFRPEELEGFLARVSTRKETIRGFKGCNYLQILQDQKNPCIVFSHSYWDSEEDLNNYRYSDFFREVWSQTKPLFAAPAQAWSLDSLHELK